MRMSVTQRDKLRKIIELATELLRDSERLSMPAMAVDSHDVPHDPIDPATREMLAHYDRR